MFKFSNQTKLAIAASHRGRMFESWQFRQGFLKQSIILEVTDYFRFEPVEGKQFDADTVLEELRSVPDDAAGHSELLDLLGRVGFRAFPTCAGKSATYMLDSRLWGEFIETIPVDW